MKDLLARMDQLALVIRNMGSGRNIDAVIVRVGRFFREFILIIEERHGNAVRDGRARVISVPAFCVT